MKTQRVIALCLCIFSIIQVRAQIRETILDLIQGNADSAIVFDSSHVEAETINQDSLLVIQLQQLLEDSKLSEANLRMEYEQYKLNVLASDSIKRHKQRQRIDSLRHTTQGSPVVVDGDTLFYLYTKKGGQSALQRAQETGELIELVGKKINLDPNRVYIEHTDIFSDIMYDTEVLVSFTDADAMWEGISRDSLAANHKHKELHVLQVARGGDGALAVRVRAPGHPQDFGQCLVIDSAGGIIIAGRLALGNGFHERHATCHHRGGQSFLFTTGPAGQHCPGQYTDFQSFLEHNLHSSMLPAICKEKVTDYMDGSFFT